MRLIDADELIEHAYRDRLDSRELIAAMINNAPTIKEIPVNVPLSLVIKALEVKADIEQEPKGHWIPVTNGRGGHECDICHEYAPSYQSGSEYLSKRCPNCGAKMER